MPSILPTLAANPVIAAVRSDDQLARALDTPVRVIFLLGGDPESLPGRVQKARSAEKLVFVHMDLVEGFSRDACGLKWLAHTARPSGILSTRAPILRAAAEENLLTVLRIFMVDSSSLATGVRMVKSCEPTLIEVMPGLVTRAIRRLSESVRQPVIAGGMLEAEQDVAAALKAGALAASTSSEILWARSGACLKR